MPADVALELVPGAVQPGSQGLLRLTVEVPAAELAVLVAGEPEGWLARASRDR